jgi:hypothetical protein
MKHKWPNFCNVSDEQMIKKTMNFPVVKC